MSLQPYSQFKAFRAITLAALRSISKSPSSIIFTIAFPLIFILVFGFLGDSKSSTIQLAFVPGSDTLNPVAQELRAYPDVKWVTSDDAGWLREELAQGRIHALVELKENPASLPRYRVHLEATMPESAKVSDLIARIEKTVFMQDKAAVLKMKELVSIRTTVTASRKLNTIDFVLPGQLGFSLLAASVFGTAFVFFNLRQSLVLKRFFATPVRRETILLGEGAARMVFQLLGATIIILVGRFCLGYTLIEGWVTFLNMLCLCALGLLVFMSFGFIISGLAKSESTIPPLSNILTLPQFLLAGTFFPVEAFPKWVQPLSKALPLTYLNDALRAVAFKGASLWEVRIDILVLLVWGAIGYFVASRVFKWE